MFKSRNTSLALMAVLASGMFRSADVDAATAGGASSAPAIPPAPTNDAIVAAEKELKAKQAAEAKAQAKAAKDAEKSAKAAEKEKAKADAQAAKDAEKAAKEKAKADAIEAKKVNQMPEQNGVRHPKPETLCGKAWAVFDALSAALKAPVSIKAALETTNPQGLSEGNVKAEYARWRKFHGVTGRVVDPRVEADKQALIDAKAKEKADKELAKQQAAAAKEAAKVEAAQAKAKKDAEAAAAKQAAQAQTPAATA